MLEDDQKFEELESKLAALSSQVESLELENEDMFFEDDVRRVIDDFKSRELAGLESEGEDFDDDESTDSSDFISVQTTSGPSFKTHWIAPESCEDMTRDLARDAFVQGAADRYGTSQQVNNGDVLILLCREPVAEEPEEGSEPEEPEPPKKICRYIGLAYNTLVHPGSTEPPSEDEELISAPVGNYEIFVWSSCECSGEPAETVVLPSIFEASSGSSTNGNYASIGDVASPDMSNADGLLTEASIRKSANTSSSNLAKGLSDTLSKNNAGYKTQLVQLSQELSRYHLDQKKNPLNFEADKKNLNTHGFESDLFVSKNLTLSNSECGNLETVSISGETFDLSLLKEGTPSLGSNFVTTAKISLGSAVSIGGTFNLDVYDTNADELAETLDVEDGSTVFLPVITEAAADGIADSDTLDTSALSQMSAAVTGDGEKFTVSIGTQITTLTANYSSGLLTHKVSPVTAAGPSVTFDIPSGSGSGPELPDGTSEDYTPDLFKASVNSGTPSAFYEKSVSIFSSSDALINFTDGIAVSLSNPSYTRISGLSLDASNNNGTAEATKLTDISVRGTYDVIYESEKTGDARYYIDYTYQDVTLTIKNGLVTETAVGDSKTEAKGPINVPGADLKYGCHPEYGCQPDPAGEFFDSSCGSGCETEELILSYRPSNIWVYTESAYENGDFCFNLESSHESIPAGADLQNQFYTNDGHLKAEKVGGKKVDNFYVNNVLIPENNIYYAEKDPYDVCNAVRFEHSFRRYRETTLEDGSRCWTFVSEHVYIPGQGDDRTVICTNNGRVVSKLDAVGINVPEYQVNNLPIGQEFYVDSRSGDYNGVSIQSTAPGNTENPPLGECSLTAQIDYQANGDSTPFADTINYAKTQSTTLVNVYFLKHDLNNGHGDFAFIDSSGDILYGLEPAVFAGEGEPFLFTLEIPQGSTGLTVHINQKYDPGTSTWELRLTSQ
jgi:sporulation protein YlmC with PRC-barrel domain